jgi:hypothetical protein
MVSAKPKGTFLEENELLNLHQIVIMKDGPFANTILVA